MIEALILALWRGYIRFLRTDKERVGVAERWVRALLLIVPFFAVFSPLLCIRAALWGPPTPPRCKPGCPMPPGIPLLV